jgi:hypothetical protein
MNMKVIAFWDVTPFNDFLLSCSEYHDLPKRPIFTTPHFRTTLKMETVGRLATTQITRRYTSAFDGTETDGH